MMPDWLQRRQTSTRSMDAQISIAERQLSTRRQTVNKRTASLLGNIHRQMTSPATLLLAGGIGFIAGELSNCPARRGDAASPAATTQANVNSRLRTMLSLLLSVRTLYNTLPITWLRKRVFQVRARPTSARRHNRATEVLNKSNSGS